jgi:hypothetical protein
VNGGAGAAVGVALVVVLLAVGSVTAPLAWPATSRARGTSVVLVAFVLALCTAVVLGPVSYGIGSVAGVCSGDSSSPSTASSLIGLAVYLAIGLWGSRRPDRFTRAWPLAVAAGAAAILVAAASPVGCSG